MSLDKSNSESTRMKIKQDKIRYSNYLATQTRFNNGLISRPGSIIAGTGSSGESSAFTNIKEGTIFISPEDQETIIIENTPVTTQTNISGSLLIGTGGYLESSVSANFAMGTQDFTIECWAKTNITYGGGWATLVSLGAAFGDDIRLCAGGDFYSPNTGNIGIIIPGSSDDMRCFASEKMIIDNWYHLALVRQGNYVLLYINGVNVILKDNLTQIGSTQIGANFNHGSTNAERKAAAAATAAATAAAAASAAATAAALAASSPSSSTANAAAVAAAAAVEAAAAADFAALEAAQAASSAGTSKFYVNSSVGGERQFNGLVSNVRVVKGKAVYTGNFTVPTAPLRIDSNTIILLNTKPDNFIKDNSSYNHTLTSTGPVSFSSNNPFTG